MRDFFSKRGADISDEEYREMTTNIRTFFELLSKWDREHNVTKGPNYSKIQTDGHAEGRHDE